MKCTCKIRSGKEYQRHCTAHLPAQQNGTTSGSPQGGLEHVSASASGGPSGTMHCPRPATLGFPEEQRIVTRATEGETAWTHKLLLVKLKVQVLGPWLHVTTARQYHLPHSPLYLISIEPGIDDPDKHLYLDNVSRNLVAQATVIYLVPCLTRVMLPADDMGYLLPDAQHLVKEAPELVMLLWGKASEYRSQPFSQVLRVGVKS